MRTWCLLLLLIPACGSDDATPASVGTGGIAGAAGLAGSGGSAGIGGAAGSGGAAGVDGGTTALCSKVIGFTQPLPQCSPETPCDRPADELNGQVLTSPSTPPSCPAGTTLMQQDVLGVTRYACAAEPPGASVTSKRPLILWFHPGGDGADTISETGLVSKSAAYDLTGDSSRPGFHLVAVQGRNLRFPTQAPRDGRHHDFYHRDLSSPSSNPDIAFADALVDSLVAGGTVDEKRIYVMGWSNGGFFAQLYAIARHDTATPGGQRVAAGAVFATASPFDDVRWDPFANVPRTPDGACRVDALPSVAVPILLVYRTCDAAVAATPEQASCFDTEPGYVTEPWIDAAKAAGISMTSLRLGGREAGATLDVEGPASSSTCTSTECTLPISYGCYCLVNHLIWPDGAYNKGSSNIDHEPAMLDSLRKNPLP
ncbi:MAG: hypothetical protein KC776_15380 [Myxococcales bacterium]|nr:hypothetical protein [Myxococcales bacterium]MCB9582677.1 hypothetical protein [Polyangiaceae bacterium]